MSIYRIPASPAWNPLPGILIDLTEQVVVAGQGYVKEMMADALKTQFADLAEKSVSYWQSLVEHTALRVREFGRLQGLDQGLLQNILGVVRVPNQTSDLTAQHWNLPDHLIPPVVCFRITTHVLTCRRFSL
jgi:hypothetical protein